MLLWLLVHAFRVLLLLVTWTHLFKNIFICIVSTGACVNVGLATHLAGRTFTHCWFMCGVVHESCGTCCCLGFSLFFLIFSVRTPSLTLFQECSHWRMQTQSTLWFSNTFSFTRTLELTCWLNLTMWIGNELFKYPWILLWNSSKCVVNMKYNSLLT